MTDIISHMDFQRKHRKHHQKRSEKLKISDIGIFLREDGNEMDKKSIYFDDWLEEHLANESQEYREEFEKELFKMDLAVQIKELRTEQKLSQREFAKKVGVSQSTIANIELGNAEPNIDTMYEIGRKNNKKLTISYS